MAPPFIVATVADTRHSTPLYISKYFAFNSKKFTYHTRPIPPTVDPPSATFSLPQPASGKSSRKGESWSKTSSILSLAVQLFFNVRAENDTREILT